MIDTDPPSLAAWLASARSARLVDGITLINPSGTVARWINADADFTIPAPDGRAFMRGPRFERGAIKQSVGLSVDNLSVDILPIFKEQPVMFGAQTLLAAAQNGSLRGATLQIERLVFDQANVYQGRWVEFAGTLAVKSTAGGRIKAEVLSELNLLDKPMPPDVYQAQCKNTLFDASCGLNRAAWRVAGSVSSVGSGLTARSGFGSALGQAAGWFDLGPVQFLTGANAGVKRTVKGFASGAFIFALPWPHAIAVSDTFEAYPGCARTQAVCSSKFSNVIRFRGEPYVPQPETVT